MTNAHSTIIGSHYCNMRLWFMLPIPKGNKEVYAVMHTTRYTIGGDIVLA